MRTAIALLAAVWLASLGAHPSAAKSSVLRGIVHDPQHRPIPGASVTILAPETHRTWKVLSNSEGEFKLPLPLPGHYIVIVKAPGFAVLKKDLAIDAKSLGVVHLQMALATVAQSVRVSDATARLTTQSATTQTAVSGKEIQQTPGADLTNSLSMITDFVPGAYVVHDMLHVRGGHQENWFFDGIPVINTNIASNVGPLINPRNIQSLEVQTGGYSSEYGDRTYGFFNAVTPSGFDQNSEVDFVASAGDFNQTDDLLSFGSHTERFAYYASLDGDRSDLGLSTPTSQIIHDQTGGLDGFASLLFNPSARNQLRLVTSLVGDNYQIPNTPDQQTTGIRDLDVERDDLVGLTWTHIFGDAAMLSFSPYFHFNRANYLGGPGDIPFVLDDNRRSSYMGALASLAIQKARHHALMGLETWRQHDNTLFALRANPGTLSAAQDFAPWANSEALFVEDQYQLTHWVSLSGGLRLTHYGGLISENAANPRLGAAMVIPKLTWVLHGYYATYYQPPPLDTLAGPLLDFALQQGYGFIPLHGERDRQWDAGLTVPLRHWYLDVDHFRTSAANFLDHDEIGNSDIFLPLTDRAALINGTEMSVRSPHIFGRVTLRVAYSNQIAQGIGPVTGGLLEFAPEGYFFLDHDQRNTLNTVLNLQLPAKSWATATFSYGSGFLNGNGPAHLPQNTLWNLSMGKSLGERLSISANALNVGNARFLLDNSNTFGGTHYINPFEFYAELRWRFHY
jgi:hypothetical protein